MIFGALAQETRLSVLRLLVGAGPSGLPAGNISDALGIPTSTTSFHLSVLEHAGLTTSKRQSRQIIHAVRPEVLSRMLAFLSDECCPGNPEAGHSGVKSPNTKPMELKPRSPAFNVLFLCTKNSGRSIMAEAILGKLAGDRFNAYSAGSDPANEPMSDVMLKLRALGHDVSHLRSKSWHEFAGPEAPRMDFVIALCDTLEGQVCPDFGDKAVTGAWPLPDPAKFHGSPAEQSTMLNELYASLNRRIGIFTSLPFGSLDRMAVRARLDEIGSGPLPASVER